MAEQKKYSFKHRLEYALFCFWGFVFSRSPYRLALALGWCVAWIGHYIGRYRVRMVYDRIRQVFPEMDRRQVRRIAWESWRNFVFNIVDTFRLQRVNEAWLRRYMLAYDETVARVRKELSHGGGAVGVSLHMGSAEVQAVSLQKMGLDVFVITGGQKNQLVDRRLNAMRGGTGIDCIPKGSGAGMFKQVFRRIKHGGLLTMLADLRLPSGGLEVNFLGHKASVVPGMGLFAKKTGVPVVPSIITREGWTHHRLRVFSAIFPDENLSFDDDVLRMTQAVFDLFDRAIRECPSQWFWYNKNWILAPVRIPKPKEAPASGEMS